MHIFERFFVAFFGILWYNKVKDGFTVFKSSTEKGNTNMKKVLSVLLTLCMIFSIGAVLSSCSHECEFATDWSSDDTAHWHACTKKDCTEIADKADHTWDDGSITTKATQEADGVKTYTCSVCGKTKTEAVTFTGMTQDEWNAALAADLFENFTYSAVSTATSEGESETSEMIIKITKDAMWGKMTMGDESEEDYIDDKEEIAYEREDFIESINMIASFENFAYDAATKTYKATKAIEFYGDSISDVTLTFANGKLVELKYSSSYEVLEINVTTTQTITISDYGTTVVTAPAQ